MVEISEAILYLCFAILLGGLVIHLIPKNHKPDVQIPHAVLMVAAVLIPLLSFVSVLRVIFYFSKNHELWQMTWYVLTQFDVGTAWVITAMLSLSLISLLSIIKTNEKRVYSYFAILIVLLLILSLGWASHVSSTYGFTGFLLHSAHFAAVTLWVGILIVVGWFSKSKDHWLSFLRWFTPLSIICVLIAIIAGILIMNYIIPINQYMKSWLVSYGQVLLIKHILIIPLVAFAFLNGFLSRVILRKDPEFDPRNGLKAESVFVLLLFIATGILGQQNPPHDIQYLLESEGASPIFLVFHNANFDPNHIHITVNGWSITLALFALFFLILLIISFVKKVHSLFSVLMGILGAAAFYLAIMLSYSF